MIALPADRSMQTDHPGAHDLPSSLQRLSTLYDVVERDVRLHGWPCRMFAIRDTNALLERIDPAVFNQDERLPYWAEMWKSSLALGERLLDSREFSGKNVLELGCGLGLAGIAAAKSGAHVVLTDYEHDALDFAWLNAERNLTQDERSLITIRYMDWREPDLPSSFQNIMGADVLYERRNFAPIQTLLERHLLPGGYGLFADPGRSVAREFLDKISSMGFAVNAEVHNSTSEAGNILFHIVHKPPASCRPPS